MIDVHDAALYAVTLGPRRALRLHLRPPFAEDRPLRFGAIENMRTVESFVTELPKPSPGVALDTVEAIEPVEGGWRITLDHAGSLFVRTEKSPTVGPATEPRA